MARGKLAQQTPPVPLELYNPINDLYVWALAADKDIGEVRLKKTTTNIASSIVRVVDPDLQIPMEADAWYAYDGLFIVSGNVRYRYGTAVNVVVANGKFVRASSDTAAAFNSVFENYPAADILTGANSSIIRITGTVYSPVKDALQFSWAQNASNVTPSSLFLGSRIQYSRIA